MPDRPNVLLVLCDQLRADALGCYGNDQVHTPAVDGLAAAGVRCTRAYTPDPVCGPARASVLTGQYPHEHGVVANNIRVPQTGETLAHRLRAAGYRTGYIGKWHLDGTPKPGFVPRGPRRQGFEFWRGFNRGHEHLRGHPLFTDDGELYWEDGYQPAVQTDMAIEFMAEHAGEEPFFCYLSWGPPHTPFEAPEEYSAMYDPAELTLRENVPEELDTPDLREDLAEYYALVTSLDDQLGRLLEVLDNEGVADDTIVVFTSDHGEQLGSLGRQRKGYPFEESVRVPMVWRYPDALPAGETRSGFVNLVDLLPTLASWAGGEVPDRARGEDVRGVLRGERAGRTATYIEGNLPFHDAWRAVRTEGYMLAVDDRLAVRHLYDMEADPDQLENLAGDPAYDEVADGLLDRLVGAAERYRDTELWARWFRRDVRGVPLDAESDVFEGDTAGPDG